MLTERIARKVLTFAPNVQSLLWNRRIERKQPDGHSAQVLISILTPAGPGANLKVSAEEYLPTFCNTLREYGLKTKFCSSMRELNRALDTGAPTILINIYCEDKYQICSQKMSEIENRCLIVFNSAELGPIISSKKKTNEYLSRAGIDVPELSNGQHRTFSNSDMGSGRRTQLMEPGQALDEQRYNVNFIDTVIEFKSQFYYTTIRLQCINGFILHAYVRARDVREGNASVHAANTPLSSDLITFLHDTIIDQHRVDLERLADRLYRALGPGFYVHDLLMERSTGRILVCETGFKFDDPSYWRHIMPIREEIPSQNVLFPIENFAKLSAERLFSCIQSCLENTTQSR